MGKRGRLNERQYVSKIYVGMKAVIQEETTACGIAALATGQFSGLPCGW